jgi:hypothetical protein
MRRLSYKREREQCPLLALSRLAARPRPRPDNVLNRKSWCALPEARRVRLRAELGPSRAVRWRKNVYCEDRLSPQCAPYPSDRHRETTARCRPGE